MNQKFSLYLDFFRFFAAMIVFVSHFAYTRFTDGDYMIVRDLNLGSDAVVFFFVLSGLVIAYTTEVKDKTLKQYSFNRMTRLYSVIIPALLLTFFYDQLGSRIAPDNYNGWWYNETPIWQQAFTGFSFTSQWFSQNFRIGSNGPYWSLSYEAAYYIIFGIMFYISGVKKYLIFLPLIFVFGFAIMFLFPIWLLGLWTYKQIRNKTLPQKYAYLCAAVPPFIYAAMLYVEIPKTLLLTTVGVLGEEFVNVTLGFSNEFIWNFIIAQLIAFHLIGMAALFDRKQSKPTVPMNKIIRWFAGATFTIYVVHYPALQFIDTILPNLEIQAIRHGLLFIIVLAICFLMAELSERRLGWLRQKLINK